MGFKSAKECHVVYFGNSRSITIPRVVRLDLYVFGFLKIPSSILYGVFKLGFVLPTYNLL